jgi:cell division control protein 24
VNPNKAAKDKLLGNQKEKKDKKDKDKSKKDKGGKSGKLQLKGRIFMTNVTDVVSIVKPGQFFSLLKQSSLTEYRSRVIYSSNLVER